jgi:hypothetical protein
VRAIGAGRSGRRAGDAVEGREVDAREDVEPTPMLTQVIGALGPRSKSGRHSPAHALPVPDRRARHTSTRCRGRAPGRPRRRRSQESG